MRCLVRAPRCPVTSSPTTSSATAPGIVLRPFTLLKCDIWRKFIERNAACPSAALSTSAASQAATFFPPVSPLSMAFVTSSRRCTSTMHRGPTPTATLRAPSPGSNLREEPIVIRQWQALLSASEACRCATSRRTAHQLGPPATARDRLKNDVINELEAGEGRLLLHTETSDGP